MARQARGENGGAPPSTGIGADGVADRREVAKFEALAAAWWDTAGPLAPLHKLNPVRIAYLLEQVSRHLGAGGAKPLGHLRVLDVGCGGGLLAEPLARLGAEVVATDPSPAAIAAARAHAEAAGVTVDYRVGTAEDRLAESEVYDLVVASEVVEHVGDVPVFLQSLAALTRPGGLVVFSTLTRTLVSLLGAIVAAEYLLRWLPRGTHDWRRFLTPAELAREARRAGLRPVEVRGIAYEPGRDTFRTERSPRINYLLTAVRS